MGLQPASAAQAAEKDVLVIDAGPGASSPMGKVAARFRVNGAYTVAVSPGGDGRSSLFLSDDVRDLAQLAICHARNPTRGPEVEDPGQPVGRILTRTLLWMLFSSYLQEMVIRGSVPFVFRGFHLPGGLKYNEAVYPLYLERGY